MKNNKKQRDRIIVLFVFIVIFVFSLIVFFIPVYKNYRIEEMKKEKILEEKRENERIKQEVRNLDEEFKTLKTIVEKTNNSENPSEIRAENYYIINPKEFSFARNVMYSDKFIYIKADAMLKYGISEKEQLYYFRNASIRSKNGLYSISPQYFLFEMPLMNGKIFCNYCRTFVFNEKTGKSTEYRNFITDNYTNLESARQMTQDEIKKMEMAEAKARDMRMFGGGYGYIRAQIEEEEEKREKEGKSLSNPNTPNIYYYQPNYSNYYKAN